MVISDAAWCKSCLHAADIGLPPRMHPRAGLPSGTQVDIGVALAVSYFTQAASGDHAVPFCMQLHAGVSSGMQLHVRCPYGIPLQVVSFLACSLMSVPESQLN